MIYLLKMVILHGKSTFFHQNPWRCPGQGALPARPVTWLAAPNLEKVRFWDSFMDFLMAFYGFIRAY
jgi:hypothetical protein